MADSRNLPKVDYMLQYMRENDTFNLNVAEIRGASVVVIEGRLCRNKRRVCGGETRKFDMFHQRQGDT